VCLFKRFCILTSLSRYVCAVVIFIVNKFEDLQSNSEVLKVANFAVFQHVCVACKSCMVQRSASKN